MIDLKFPRYSLANHGCHSFLEVEAIDGVVDDEDYDGDHEASAISPHVCGGGQGGQLDKYQTFCYGAPLDEGARDQK